MGNAQEIRNKVIAARDKKKWDNKDWHRAIRIDQRVLEAIDSGDMDLSSPECSQILELILSETKNRKTPDLLRFDKPQVIAFDIHKGGGGKTTMAVNIAYELGLRGYNVLLIDGDSQGDSTSIILAENEEKVMQADSFSKEMEQKNLYKCMNEEYKDMDARKHIICSDYDGVDVLASNTQLAKMDAYLSTVEFGEELFAHALEGVIEENYYDFVLVDMDKNLGLFNTTILCGCDYIIIPCECAMFHLKGLIVMDTQIEKVKRYNKSLKVLGIVLNKVDERKKMIEEAKAVAEERFPGLLFKNVLRVDSNIENSQFAFQPVGCYNKRSRANNEIKIIVDEMLERIRKGNV